MKVLANQKCRTTSDNGVCDPINRSDTMPDASYGQFNRAVCLIDFCESFEPAWEKPCCQIGRKTTATRIAEPIGANDTGHCWVASTYFNNAQTRYRKRSTVRPAIKSAKES
jgi:hypothetical protein